jgi:twinkle protein
LLEDLRAAYQTKGVDDKPRVFGPQVKIAAVNDLWRRGMPPGDKTGWPSVDRHYTVAPGQFTVVTGWPGAGKSEWLDALLVNLSRQGWKIVYFSPENSPVEIHISKLLEKLSGKPFGSGPNERIAQDELPEYIDELSQSFGFIEFDSGALTAHGVIEAATPWLAQHAGAKRGLVIDPWNELQHWRPGGLSETEYISQTLSVVRNWARINNVHVWIVAHPQKIPRMEGRLPVPRPDMISGSQHWWNKADCAVTVYRNPDEPESRLVDIVVQKIRFKHIGMPGTVQLEYSRVTGRYREPRGADLYVVAKDGD